MASVWRQKWLRYAVLAMLVLMAAWLAERGARSMLAKHWDRKLDRVGDEQWPTQLRRLLALGEPGLKRVALRVGSPRREWSEMAGSVLHERLDDWKLAAPAKALAEMTVLAETLAEHVDAWEPPARDVAAGLVRRMLMWRVEPRHGDSRRLLMCCERVLDATVPLEKSARHERAVGPERIVVAHDPFERRQDYERWAAKDDLILPGGALRMSPLAELPDEVPEETDGVTEVETEDVAGVEPRRLVLDEGPLRGARPAIEPGASPTGEALADGQREEVGREKLPETIRLVRMLHEGDGEEVARAQSGLQEQGFSLGQINVVKQLCDPDPRVRLQWTRQLPLVPGMNAKPWLLWLTQDEAAEVRLVAVALLATSNDPDLVERMREIAAQDADARVRRQAERFLNGVGRR